MSVDTAVLRSPARRDARPLTRGLHRLVQVIFVITVVALAISAALLVTGHKLLVVRSGSMEPAIGVGDVIATRPVSPSEVSVGDIVTFNDPSRSGSTVTHRVKKVVDEGSVHSFVTKGDTNGGVEKWQIESDGTLGRYIFRVPRAGYALSYARTPAIRLAVGIGAATIFLMVALKRIWAG